MSVRSFVLKNLWIIITRFVNYSNEIFFAFMIFRTVSYWKKGRSRKTGVSSCMFFIILISILFINSFKFLLLLFMRSWSFLSLVTSWLPPNSEASKLILSNLDTILSFLTMVAEFVLFLLWLFCKLITVEITCSPNN